MRVLELLQDDYNLYCLVIYHIEFGTELEAYAYSRELFHRAMANNGVSYNESITI